MSTGPRHRLTTPRARANAKELRRTATDAEKAMWHLLRDRRLNRFKFRRQAPLEGYIVDFVCFDQKLIVEIDGSQHFESASDRIRDINLERAGFRILRFWNNDVLQKRGSVLEYVLNHLER